MKPYLNDLVNVQFRQYPLTTLVTPEYLLKFHIDMNIRLIIHDYHEQFIPVLFYILDEGQYGALAGKCCNGIRYGSEAHEYVSLPQIEISKT